jgi:hypothetical protein
MRAGFRADLAQLISRVFVDHRCSPRLSAGRGQNAGAAAVAPVVSNSGAGRSQVYRSQSGVILSYIVDQDSPGLTRRAKCAVGFLSLSRTQQTRRITWPCGRLDAKTRVPVSVLPSQIEACAFWLSHNDRRGAAACSDSRHDIAHRRLSEGYLLSSDGMHEALDRNAPWRLPTKGHRRAK